MNIPSCLPGMRQGELKDLGGLAEFTAAYQQHGRQSFVPQPNMLGPPNVQNFSTWSAPQAAPAPYGYPSYPYPLYPNQAPLQAWQQFSTAPDMKAALQLPPQAMPSLTATASDASQISTVTTKREEAQIASFLQAQQSFLQRAATLSSLNANSGMANGPSRQVAGSSKNTSQYAMSAATNTGDKLATDQRRPTSSTSTMNMHSQVTGGAESAAVSDDLLMRVVKGDGSAIDLLSRSCNNLRQHPPAASPTGNTWSKPGISAEPYRKAAGTRFRNSLSAPSESFRPAPSTTPPSLSTIAELDTQLAGLKCPPEQMKSYMGTGQFYQARMLMLNQQEQFMQQLYDLHRIVSVQKLLTAELQSPEHKSTILHQTVSQQKEKLEKQLRRDLHLLHNIPTSLRNPWIKNTSAPDIQQFRISKDSKEGRSLPCPAPQHPAHRSSPASKPTPPTSWAAPSSQNHTHSRINASHVLPSPSTVSEASLPQPTASQNPLPTLSKPTLIRPVPTALQPPPPYQAVDIHSMWVAKHGTSSSIKGSQCSQPTTSLPHISLPSQLTGPQITGLSSDCMASFGLGLSSLSAGGSLAGGSLVHSSTRDVQSKTRVRYWWQDEAAAFGGVGMPDEMPSSRQTGSVALSKDDHRVRPSDAHGPLKKRAKYKEGVQVSTLDMVQESGGGSVVDRQTSTKVTVADQQAGKEATSAGRSKPEASGSKQHKRKRHVVQSQASDSGGSENSVPTVTLERQRSKDTKAVVVKPVSAAVKQGGDEDEEVSNDPAAGHTARSAANILLSISSSFRPS